MTWSQVQKGFACNKQTEHSISGFSCWRFELLLFFTPPLSLTVICFIYSHHFLLISTKVRICTLGIATHIVMSISGVGVGDERRSTGLLALWKGRKVQATGNASSYKKMRKDAFIFWEGKTEKWLGLRPRKGSHVNKKTEHSISIILLTVWVAIMSSPPLIVICFIYSHHFLLIFVTVEKTVRICTLGKITHIVMSI